MVLSLIIEGIAQNTTDNVYLPEIGGDEEVTGSSTEKAILRWALKLGMNFEAARSRSSILHVFQFNSEKKRGGVAVKLDQCRLLISLFYLSDVRFIRTLRHLVLQCAKRILTGSNMRRDPRILKHIFSFYFLINSGPRILKLLYYEFFLLDD